MDLPGNTKQIALYLNVLLKNKKIKGVNWVYLGKRTCSRHM